MAHNGALALHACSPSTAKCASCSTFSSSVLWPSELIQPTTLEHLTHAAGKGFDVPILTRELKRCNLELPGDWLWADSLKFAQKRWRGKAPDGNGLQSLRAHFGLQQRRVHAC